MRCGAGSVGGQTFRRGESQGFAYLSDEKIFALQPDEFEIILTADGSHTVYSPVFDEHYHSHHGALAESRHVFIDAGLRHVAPKVIGGPVRICEMGFGTGLNALLAAQFADKEGVEVEYTGVEKFPLPREIHEELNYPNLSGMEGTAETYRNLSTAPRGVRSSLSDRFHFTILEGDFFEVELPSESFDLIFFDAFGSRAQPQMWEGNVLNRCFEILAPGGVWVTYASKGSSRRAMESMGFAVERMTGAPGKREMMRATKLKNTAEDVSL